MSSEMSFLLADRKGAIVYLKKEHAKTLRALHEEIRELQQKCSRLTFELTMSGSHCNEKTECNEPTPFLGKELAEARSELVLLRSQLSMQEEGIELMQQRMKQLTKELSSAKQSKQDIIRICNYELEQKAKTIAQLTAHLHKASMRNHYSVEQVSPLSTPRGHHPLSFRPPTEHQSNRTSPKDERPFSAHCGQLVTWPTTPVSHHAPPLTSSTPSVRRASGVQRRRLARSLEHPASIPSPNNALASSADLASVGWQSLPRGPSRQMTPPELPEAVATIKPVLPPIGDESAGRDSVDTEDEMPRKVSSLHPEVEPATLPGAPVVGVAGCHRRFVLAKSQGLSSAPCASLRLLNYPQMQPVGSIVQKIHPQESDLVEQTEGTLLVKQKVSRRGDSSNSVLQH